MRFAIGGVSLGTPAKYSPLHRVVAKPSSRPLLAINPASLGDSRCRAYLTKGFRDERHDNRSAHRAPQLHAPREFFPLLSLEYSTRPLTTTHSVPHRRHNQLHKQPHLPSDLESRNRAPKHSPRAPRFQARSHVRHDDPGHRRGRKHPVPRGAAGD